MEYAALISFAVLVVSWMVLPASNERALEEKLPALITRTAGAKA